MKNILVLFVLLSTVTICKAQNSKNIIGKWAYVDLHDKSALDDATKEMAPMLFSQLIVNFRADNTMSLKMRKTPDHGTYKFDETDENLIHAISATGKPMPITIVKLVEDELIIKMGQLAPMVLKKVSAEPDPQ